MRVLPAIRAFFERRRLLWCLLLAALALAVNGPRYAGMAYPARFIADSVQDWASARNHFAGEPIYAHHDRTFPLYLGVSNDFGEKLTIERNAHPPTSVLLALPLAGFDYPTAHLLRTLASLGALAGAAWLLCRQLGSPGWFWGPAVAAVVFLSAPLRHEVQQGNWSAFLLLLLTAAWAAERTGRSRLAGGLLGLAAAIKLFPGLLFLPLLAMRRWATVAWGAAALAGLTAVTALVLGPECYADYVTDVMPAIGEWRGARANYSVPGYWWKLFDPGRKNGPALLFPSPLLAQALSLASGLALAGVVVLVARRARTPQQRDGAFVLAVTAMTLASPTSWPYYSMLLFLPMAVLWTHLPKRRWPLLAYLASGTIVMGLLLPKLGLPPLPATLLQGSQLLYARLGLFALGVFVWLDRPQRAAAEEPALLAFPAPAEAPLRRAA